MEDRVQHTSRALRVLGDAVWLDERSRRSSRLSLMTSSVTSLTECLRVPGQHPRLLRDTGGTRRPHPPRPPAASGEPPLREGREVRVPPLHCPVPRLRGVQREDHHGPLQDRGSDVVAYPHRQERTPEIPRVLQFLSEVYLGVQFNCPATDSINIYQGPVPLDTRSRLHLHCRTRKSNLFWRLTLPTPAQGPCCLNGPLTVRYAPVPFSLAI